MPFLLALDPENNPSNLVLCSNMEELVLCNTWCYVPKYLIRTAKNRALRGARLSLVTFVDLSGRRRVEEVSELEEYVTRVEYRINTRHSWDGNPGESEQA